MENKTVDLQWKAKARKDAVNVLRNKTNNVETVIADLLNQNLLLRTVNNQLGVNMSSLDNRTTDLKLSTPTPFNRTTNLLVQTDFTQGVVETL